MQFIIGGMKYNTDNMEKIADVKKRYEVQNYFTQALYPGKEVGRTYDCELWRSKKGNWLLTHEADYRYIGEAIEEKEAKALSMKYATGIYEEMYGELPEA